MRELPFNPVLVWASGRIKKNKNVIVIINGATGSGKTYAALELARQMAEEFNTPFTVSDNMAFNFADILKKTMYPQNQKPGSCFLFEEVGSVGSGSAARQWQSQMNNFFFSFMQTTRHRNQILIMTCPHFSFLERGARSLVHMQMEVINIDFQNQKVRLKPFLIQVNSRTGQFYFKYMRVKFNGRKIAFKILAVPKPPGDMVKEYEKLKSKFTTELNRSMLEESGNEKKKPYNNKIDKKAYIARRKAGMTKADIARSFDCVPQSIYEFEKRSLSKEELKDIESHTRIIGKVRRS